MTIAREASLDEQVVDESEIALVARARKGDPAAWNELVRNHQEHIFRLAYLVLRDAAEAEDVAQEAFVRAFLSLDSFDSNRPLRPWLTRIAVNLARNRRRALGRYLNQLRRLFSDEPEPERTNAGPENAVQNHWLANDLWTAVQRLSPIRQEVVYLRYFLAMSEADMAEALEIPKGTIKSRLHRALAELRRIIEDDFPELRDHFIEE